MTTKLVCPACEASLRLATPVAAGKQIRCPKCKEVFRAPSDETEVMAIEDVEVAEVVTAPETEDLPIARARRRARDVEEEEDDEPRRPRRRKSHPAKER